MSELFAATEEKQVKTVDLINDKTELGPTKEVTVTSSGSNCKGSPAKDSESHNQNGVVLVPSTNDELVVDTAIFGTASAVSVTTSVDDKSEPRKPFPIKKKKPVAEAKEASSVQEATAQTQQTSSESTDASVDEKSEPKKCARTKKRKFVAEAKKNSNLQEAPTKIQLTSPETTATSADDKSETRKFAAEAKESIVQEASVTFQQTSTESTAASTDDKRSKPPKSASAKEIRATAKATKNSNAKVAADTIPRTATGCALPNEEYARLEKRYTERQMELVHRASDELEEEDFSRFSSDANVSFTGNIDDFCVFPDQLVGSLAILVQGR